MYGYPESRRAVRPSPIFLAFVAVAVLGGVLAWTGDPGATSARVGVFVMILGAWVVSVCLHEFMHAYLAYRAGDRSVEAAGYLTLNPLKYSHPVLSLLLPLLFIVQGGIGLPGGAVYLHPGQFRSRAMQSAVSFAGPATNAVIGVGVLLLIPDDRSTPHGAFWTGLAFFGFLQLSAAFLNLLPVPGLDGYSIIEPYLSAETRRSLEPVKPWGLIGIFVLLQIDAVNERFIQTVSSLYRMTGADERLWRLGFGAFQFWRT